MNELAPPRVFLHDGNFTRLGQLTTATQIQRGYKHLTPQQVNTASVQIAINDPLLPDLVRNDGLGRVLVIESDGYPVPWVGVVGEPDGDVGAGVMQIPAKGWGRILNDRRFGAGDGFTGTPGSVFAAMIDRLNAINPMGLSVGTVSDPGGPYSVSLSEVSGLQGLNKLAQETGAEWWLNIEQAGDSGIEITANFGPDRGENHLGDTTLVDPSDTCEVTNYKFNPNGSAYASTITGGQASVTQDYESRSRTTAVLTTAPSGLQEYGRGVPSHTLKLAEEQTGFRERHGLVFFPSGSGNTPATRSHILQVVESVRGEGTITQAAVAALERTPFAVRRARISCYWDGPGSWDNLLVGNVVRLESDTAFGTGFRGPISIVGVQPVEQVGLCDLTVWIGIGEED